MKKLLFVVNTTTFFLSHRLPVALAAKAAGFDVHVATGSSDHKLLESLQGFGFSHHFFPLSRSGTNLITELKSFLALRKIMQKLAPDIVHLVTIKPVLYGGLAARVSKVPAVVAAISGLGSVFIENGFFSRIIRSFVRFLYKSALRHPNLKIIFQNEDDKHILLRNCHLPEDKAVMIRGSGVTLSDYPNLPEPEGIPVVTFAARLLREKGICEFVEAAEILTKKNISARFLIAGSIDPGNPSTISDDKITGWSKAGLVEILGHQEDIAGLFSRSNIVCLPSYREGLPKVLVEAASCGRAVVTTDVPGCRDAITKDVTGLLVPVRDAVALADAIEYLLKNPVKRHQMASAGRLLAERQLNIKTVVDKHLEIYQLLAAKVGK